MSLRRVSVHAGGDAVEPLRARFVELVPAGFEERDDDGGVELVAYVPAEEADALLAALPGATTEPVEEGWEDTWREFHRPVVVGGLWLGPPWERPPDPSRAVVIDPGRAFGTGAHPTTRLCVDLLATTASRGSLLDVGCGSGVLAITAARLGFEPVVAVDVDPVAVDTTRANAAANGVAVAALVARCAHGAAAGGRRRSGQRAARPRRVDPRATRSARGDHVGVPGRRAARASRLGARRGARAGRLERGPVPTAVTGAGSFRCLCHHPGMYASTR